MQCLSHSLRYFFSNDKQKAPGLWISWFQSMLSGTAPDIKLTELVFKGRKYIPPDLLKEIASIGGIMCGWDE